MTASELAATGRLLTPSEEGHAFWRARMAVLRSLGRLAVERSWLQVVCVGLATLLLWVGLFILFHEGFRFVKIGLAHPGLRAQLIHAVFNIFFLTLTVMLFFSSAIILYAGLYRGEEVKFLLTTPARPARIVLFKYDEAVFFSGWGFILLGSPMLLAYGIVFQAPSHFYLWLLPFILSFVYIPTSVGAIACLLVVRVLPAVRVHAVALAVMVVLGSGIYFAWQIAGYQSRDMMSMNWFSDVLSRLEFSEQRLLPSWWLSSGLLEATHPIDTLGGPASWRESAMFLAVLATNAMLLQVILWHTAKRIFRDSYSGIQGIVPSARSHRVSRVDRFVEWMCSPFPGTIRIMIVKDLRLFRRDPMQWSQLAIFVGLLLLYFFNVRRFDYSGVMERWVNVMGFLNVSVVGLLLATFTTRFVFPTISLEGRRFWVLATAPIHRDTIVWGKFWFACLGSLVPCSMLVLASDLALGIGQRSWMIVALHQLECWLLCIGLAALAVGMGARMPSFRETSPARIAAGFGGTLNLVISSFYIIGIVMLTAIPGVLWLESQKAIAYSDWMIGGAYGLGSPSSLVIGTVASVCLAIVTTVIPMRSGLRAFRQMEY